MADIGQHRSLLILHPQDENQASGMYENVESTVQFASSVGLLDQSKPAPWIRVNTNMKPLYESAIERTYIFAVKPPTAKDLVANNNRVDHHIPQTLTQKLLSEKQDETKHKCLEPEEEWSLAKWKKDSSLEEKEMPVEIRHEAILKSFGSGISGKQIWKKVSKSIAKDELADCNACFQRVKNAVFIFYFESKGDLVAKWLQKTFGDKVTLHVVQ